tara:strand:+ start:1945 stop:2412 length:468 start_codon:yes stop_codon:yes gene_type:complete
MKLTNQLQNIVDEAKADFDVSTAAGQKRLFWQAHDQIAKKNRASGLVPPDPSKVSDPDRSRREEDKRIWKEYEIAITNAAKDFMKKLKLHPSTYYLYGVPAGMGKPVRFEFFRDNESPPSGFQLVWNAGYRGRASQKEIEAFVRNGSRHFPVLRT